MFDLTTFPTVFDSHVHIPGEDGRILQWAPATRDTDQMVAYLDRLGIAGAILMPALTGKARSHDDLAKGHREVARMMDKYPGRFTGGVVVDPRWPDEALAEMNYCRRELNFACLGECAAYMGGYKYDSPGFEAMIREAIKLDMFINIHCSPQEMDGFAGKFPQATFVYPHFPDMNGLGPLMGMLTRRSNVYFDICGSQYVRMGLVEMVVRAIGAGRVMFGSDYTICDPSTVMARVAYADISEDDKAQIFSRTALKLLEDRGVQFPFSP